MKKDVGKRIFEENMETRITVRLDNKHKDIIEKVMQEKKFNSLSEAIRFIIEQFQMQNK